MLCLLSWETVLQAAKDLHITEGSSKVSGALYMAGQEHLDLLLEAYSIYSHTNPLHTDVWPSMRQLESDVIAMTASMLGGQCTECSIHKESVDVIAVHVALHGEYDLSLSLPGMSQDANMSNERLIVFVSAPPFCTCGLLTCF